ncbi:MAG: YhcN/YlaJ family sporulation lipoprotein, partial [Bacillaceae bacterium]
MKKAVLFFMVMILLTGCNVRYDKPFYYAYVQKQSDGTLVRSDSVHSKEDSNYTDKALQVADSVLNYKEVKEVAVFYTKGDVIVGYSLKNDYRDRNVPGTTNDNVTPNVP